jgi:hypothetical protein
MAMKAPLTEDEEVVESGFEDQLAFPNTIPFASRIADGCAHGLTKRELFAAMAMQGIFHAEVFLDMTPAAHAKEAVLIADALLKELAK